MAPKKKAVKSRVPKIPRNSNPGIAFYKNNDYHKINDYLRCGREPASPPTKEDLERYINLICKYMKPGIPYCPLYRGTGYREFGLSDGSFKRLESMVGHTFKWKAFTSTSFDRHCVEQFNKGILMILTPSPSVLFDDLTKYDNLQYSRTEKEILLHKNTFYKIEKVTQSESASGLKKYVTVEALLTRTQRDPTVPYQYGLP